MTLTMLICNAMNKKILALVAMMATVLPVFSRTEYSKAGFFTVDGTGRTVASMNPAWRFHRGDVSGASDPAFADSTWEVVSLPHGIEILPVEASGCVNYQGPVWYRKHFSLSDSLAGKKLFLHFEAIMGKSKVWVNGKEVAMHYGGYLPVVADITDAVDRDGDNVIAVRADNSDDPSYPPGKPQDMLDFAYFGGIYRDCWLVAHDKLHITDPNYENVVAGGGLAVWYDNVGAGKADVNTRLHIRNEAKTDFSGRLEYVLVDAAGDTAAVTRRNIKVAKGAATSIPSKFNVGNARLWSPRAPHLYDLYVRIYDRKGSVVDGYRRRIGIRSLEFKGKDGFWLNGEPYDEPLIGANRHQDYALVGNAVSNSAHRRDALKLKEAGLNVIRNAHCPQDPAFMDACDELGLLVIDNTPGWQFWNDAPEFGQRVFSDIRNLVRRDRNHPSVWLWEPILNETWYPADFAAKARATVDEEYPWPGCYSASDSEARGSENFPIWFAHPKSMSDAPGEIDPSRTYFTREWGDNVDDWNSHNSPSRVSRAWGEEPMRIQARHYSQPSYNVTSYETLMSQSRQHVGGCLWHSFDHQRGYHPDPFYGGIMDAFRQPKYSYYMFMSQRPAQTDSLYVAGTGPMVRIAHEMTPFSGGDVTVYSNCDEVRLTFNAGGVPMVYRRDVMKLQGMRNPPVVFDNVYDFMADKALTRSRKADDVYLLAEGLIDGKVVATHKVQPARRPEKIIMWVDSVGGERLKADGSDFVTVIAAVADRNGRIKRLNNSILHFEIEGEGVLITGSDNDNVRLEWGTAPVIVRSTLRNGTIRVRASMVKAGVHRPVSGELTIESVPSDVDMIYSDKEAMLVGKGRLGMPSGDGVSIDPEQERSAREKSAARLLEVERQQSEFGE